MDYLHCVKYTANKLIYVVHDSF